jgi:hypothetical protein
MANTHKHSHRHVFYQVCFVMQVCDTASEEFVADGIQKILFLNGMSINTIRSVSVKRVTERLTDKESPGVEQSL